MNFNRNAGIPQQTLEIYDTDTRTGSRWHNGRFLAMCIGVCLLTGSNAFITSNRIHSISTKTGNVSFLAAAVNGNSKQPIAASKSKNKRRPPPPGKQRYKKKYNARMAQAIALNKKLISCDSTEEILSLLAATPGALTKMAGGGALNSVNWSTACHRMARFCSYDQDVRKKTLMDPRFALFLCGLSEAMAGMDFTTSLSDYQADNKSGKSGGKSSSLTFNSRECSNIAWAIAKIRLAPPQSALPLDLSQENQSVKMVETSLKCRSQVLEGARERTQLWIPTLSLLSGRLLDTISYMSIKSTAAFNTQETSNLLWSLATAQRADPDVFQHISLSLADNMSSATSVKPQEFSNGIWAFATAGIDGTGQEKLIKYTAEALTDDPSYIDEWKCNEQSCACWGVATILSNKNQRLPEEDAHALTILRKVAAAIRIRADEFKSQELTNFCWSCATVGFGTMGERRGNALNEYVYLKSDDPEGDRELMERALDAVTKSALPRLHTFRSMELNNLAYAYARLGRTEEQELYAGIARELGRPRRVVAGTDIGTTLWSFATANFFDEEAYRTVVSRIDENAARSYQPRELSNSVWALATAVVPVKYPDAFDTTLVPEDLRPDWRDDPVTACFAVAANELMRRPHEFKSQELKDVTWACSKAGIRHPVLFKTVAEYLVGKESDVVPMGELHCGKGLDTFTPQGCGNLVYSYGKQAQLAAETVKRVDGISSASTGRLFVYSTICVDVGESLIKRLFNCCAETDIAKFDDLAKLSAQDLSNTAWAFSVLGLRHTRFFEAVSRQVIQRLSRATNTYGGFKGIEVANLLWSCATVNCHFPEMIDAISLHMCQACRQPDGTYTAHSISKYCIRQELAMIAWSCAVMAHYPPDLMELLYTGLVGKGDERKADYLSNVFGDGGLQQQAIMSLLYVQMAIDMEWPENDLTLPENFPDGWDAAAEDTSVDSLLYILSLSTSRIQSDVSSALDRIGFPHVQEHVIAMDELVRNHGIQLSHKPAFEILSIDIADVQDKVGIEVDGPGHYCTVLDTWSPQEEARGYAKLTNGKMEYQFEWDDRQQMNGSTALKDRLLRGMGWKILHIPFWSWYALNGNAAKEDEYCPDLLKEV